MNAMTANLAAALDQESNVVQLALSDPHAKVERLEDIMRRHASEARQRAAETQKELRRTVASLDAEIERLQQQKHDAKLGAARKIEADERTVTKCEAFLSAE